MLGSVGYKSISNGLLYQFDIYDGNMNRGKRSQRPTACTQAFLMHMEQQRRMKLGPEAPPMEEGAAT